MNKENLLRNIFYYEDYRKFIEDYIAFMQATNSNFSLRKFNRDCGFSSPSFISEVKKGKRNLSEHSIIKLVQKIGFKENEARYFHFLVLYNQVKDNENALIYKDELFRLREYNKKFYKLKSKEFNYISKWYFPVLYELVCFAKWDDDYSKLAKLVEPEITEEQAKQGVEELLKIGVIKRSSDGKYIQTSALITTVDIPNFVKKKYRKSFIEVNIDSIDRFDLHERYVSLATIPLNEDLYKKVCNKLDEIRQMVMQESANINKYDRVYNFLLNISPVSKKINIEVEND